MKFNTKKSNTEIKNVKRSDIEKKLKQLDNAIDDATNSSAEMTKVVLGVVVIGAIALAFYAGRRRALRKKMLVRFIRSK